MKKYLVIGNPIEHSLSPKLHNHWINENNINATYEKKQINEKEINEIINQIKSEKISGINVTIPFKKTVIAYVDELTDSANEAQSVNTIFKKNNKIIGENTDIGGFELSLKYINHEVKGKKVFIIGAGGVAPSIIIALRRMGVKEIVVSNRTKEKAEKLKNIYSKLEVINWGETPTFDVVINATSLGLKTSDEVKIDYNKIGSSKLFYDVIYNPPETNFLKKAKNAGNKIVNGKMMFIYQAQLAFNIWHGIKPEVKENLLNS